MSETVNGETQARVPSFVPEKRRIVCNSREMEEAILRALDAFAQNPLIDQQWLAVGRTHIEQGFMAVNRAVLGQVRISLPSDSEKAV